MDIEIEAKFLDVDTAALRAKLAEVGAKKEHPEILMKREVFDYPNLRLEKIGGWVRVREEGDKITLSYKQLNDRTLHGTQEVTLFVDDFKKACKFLIALGLEKKAHQETKREKWFLDDVEITIDTWPWIPTFVELEGPSEAMLRDVAQKLVFDWRHAMHGSVETAYQKYYDFTEQEIDHWESITFIPPPDWLLARKR